MQNSPKGNKTPKWDRIQRVWTDEQSTQFAHIKIILSSWNQQSYNQQQVYWSELIIRSETYTYIYYHCHLGSNLTNNRMSKFSKRCATLLGFKLFCRTVLFAFFDFIGSFTQKDTILCSCWCSKCPGCFHWYWIMLHWTICINQDLITFG